MANPFFSGRIPLDLYERIEQHVQETGQSKTEILIDALAAYLKFPISRPATVTTNSEVDERLKSLENRVTALELEVLLDKSGDKEAVIRLDNNEQEDYVVADNVDKAIDNEVLAAEKEDVLFEGIDNKADNETNHKLGETEPTSIESVARDNNLDNISDNSEEKAKDQEELVTEQQPDASIQHKSFESLNSIDFAQATGIERKLLDDQKTKIRNKYRKLDKQIPEKQLLEHPEQLSFNKPLLINDYPYDLFFLGQDENGRNLWTAVPFDNSRYQQLSIEN